MQPTLQITDSVVQELGPGLVSIAERAVRSRAEAEDLVQEMWISALHSSPTFEGRSSLRTWLTAILRRRIADRYRKTRPVMPFEEELFESGVEDVAQRLSTLEPVAHAMRLMPELTELERSALSLYALDDLDREEACERLGITRGHLRVLLHRARRKLEVVTR
jgi:RNA polymerase sigma factor (sigma-70 family)